MTDPTQYGQPPRFDPAARHEVRVHDVEYARRDGVPLLARVYRPVAPGPWPALIDVHGGAWSYFDRTGDVTYDHALASSGMVVVALDFRQGGEHPFPASVRDVIAGVRWVRANAASLEASTEPLGIVGGSSGGHLCLLAAICPAEPEFQEPADAGAQPGSARIDYALALWPIADPLARYEYLEPLLAGFEKRDDDPFFDPRLLRGGHEAHFRDAATMHRASIPRIVNAREFQALPPIWVAHAERDRNVTRAMSEALVGAYRDAGGAAELELFEGVGHAFANYPGAAAERCVERMRTFVASRLRAAASGR